MPLLSVLGPGAHGFRWVTQGGPMARMWGVILDRGGVQKARSAGCPGQPDGPCGAQLGNPPDWVTFAGVPLNWLPIGDFYSRLGVGTKVLDRGLSTFVGSPLLRPAAEWGRTGGCVPGVAPWGPFRSSDLEGRAWDRFPCDRFGTPGLRAWAHQLRFSLNPSLGP